MILGWKERRNCKKRFKFPECLVVPCRHECVERFNKGRKITLVLGGGGVNEKKKPKRINKAEKIKYYDGDTLKSLRKLLVGTSFGQSKSEGVIKWKFNGRIVIWVRKALENEVELEVPKDFPHPKVHTAGSRRLLVVHLTKPESLKLRRAILDWLRNQ